MEPRGRRVPITGLGTGRVGRKVLVAKCSWGQANVCGVGERGSRTASQEEVRGVRM